jgi:hypothetical protein
VLFWREFWQKFNLFRLNYFTLRFENFARALRIG